MKLDELERKIKFLFSVGLELQSSTKPISCYTHKKLNKDRFMQGFNL